MKTPFDVAVDILQRRTDEIRTSIAIIADQLGEITAARSTLSTAMRNESILAASNWDMPSEAYLARLCAAGESLSADQRRCEAQLVMLREQARESYASLQAILGAAQGFVVEADRAADTAEQSRFDDISAARFARSRYQSRSAQQRRLAG